MEKLFYVIICIIVGDVRFIVGFFEVVCFCYKVEVGFFVEYVYVEGFFWCLVFLIDMF